MADLSDYRKEIDVVRKVAAYKKEHNLPVLHAGREEEVLRKAADSLKNPTYVPQIRQFMNQVMELSRASQHQQIADSQPPIQGNSHICSRADSDILGSRARSPSRPCSTFLVRGVRLRPIRRSRMCSPPFTLGRLISG